MRHYLSGGEGTIPGKRRTGEGKSNMISLREGERSFKTRFKTVRSKKSY